MRKLSKSKDWFQVLAGIALIFAGGCANIGNAPAGPSIAEVKANFDAKPIEQRAKEINDMSIPAGIKQQTIKAMYDKVGKTPPPDLLCPPGTRPAPVTSH